MMHNKAINPLAAASRRPRVMASVMRREACQRMVGSRISAAVVFLILVVLGCGKDHPNQPEGTPHIQPPNWLASWGDSGSTAGLFDFPTGIAVANDGRVYVANNGDDHVEVLSRSGRHLASWPGRSLRSSSAFLHPVSVAASADGGVVVGDIIGDVEMLDSLGATLRALSWSKAPLIENPTFVDVDEAGNTYCCNSSGKHVIQFSPSGTFVRDLGPDSTALGTTRYPCDLVAASARGRIYVVDSFHRSIVVMDLDGQLVQAIHALSDSSDAMSSPYGIDVDSGGRLFVSDRGRDQIHVFDFDGHYLLSWGEHGSGPGQFSGPAGICVDGEGRVYVTETGNNRVQVFQWHAT